MSSNISYKWLLAAKLIKLIIIIIREWITCTCSVLMTESVCPFCGTVTALSPHRSDDCMASAVTLMLTFPTTNTQILFALTNKRTVSFIHKSRALKMWCSRRDFYSILLGGISTRFGCKDFYAWAGLVPVNEKGECYSIQSHSR